MWIDKQCEVSRYVPDFLSEIRELSALYAVQSQLCDSLRRMAAKWVENCLIASCDEQTLRHWEELLSVSSPIGESLEERRQAVLARFCTQTPISEKRIREVAQTFLGCEVILRCDPANYSVAVGYKGQSKLSDFTPLLRLLEELVPATMLVTVGYAYLTMEQLDAQQLDWAALDQMNMPFEEFEKGDWLDAD